MLEMPYRLSLIPIKILVVPTEWTEISQDKGNGHLAFVTPKANNNSYTGEHSGVTVAPTYLSNGTWRMLTVHWNAAAKH